MSEALVSVIIPCYNAERWLKKTIESVLLQTYMPIQIIVSDDGSVDDSVKIASSFGSLVEIISEKNGGVAAAQNRGFELSKGEWVQFLGADDLLHPQKIELSLLVASNYSNVPFIWAPVSIVKEEFSLIDIERFDKDRVVSGAYVGSDILCATYAPASALFRKEFLLSIGKWDEDLRRWVDLEYHTRMAALNPGFACISQPLYFYRSHSGSRISNSNYSFTRFQEGRLSLERSRYNLERSCIERSDVAKYLFPFYVNLARAAAANGESKEFANLISEASRLSDRRSFVVKSLAARLLNRLLGPLWTSSIIEKVLAWRNR